MGFPRSRQAEDQDVLCAVDKLAFAESRDLTPDAQGQPFLIEDLKVGGIILFAVNLKSPDQIKELCLGIQEHARSCGQPPLFIAVDQEGGQVARLKPPFTQFPGNPHIHTVEDAVRFAQITAAELNRVGINMNMAPVMDVAPEDINSIMAERAFSGNPARVPD